MNTVKHSSSNIFAWLARPGDLGLGMQRKHRWQPTVHLYILPPQQPEKSGMTARRKQVTRLSPKHSHMCNVGVGRRKSKYTLHMHLPSEIKRISGRRISSRRFDLWDASVASKLLAMASPIANIIKRYLKAYHTGCSLNQTSKKTAVLPRVLPPSGDVAGDAPALA